MNEQEIWMTAIPTDYRYVPDFVEVVDDSKGYAIPVSIGDEFVVNENAMDDTVSKLSSKYTLQVKRSKIDGFIIFRIGEKQEGIDLIWKQKDEKFDGAEHVLWSNSIY